MRDDEGQALHHVATFLPAYVSAEMVVDILALPGPLRRFPRRVGFGQEFFAPYATQQIHSGCSLVVDVLGSQQFVQPPASSSEAALNLLQTSVRRLSAIHSEDPHSPNSRRAIFFNRSIEKEGKISSD